MFSIFIITSYDSTLYLSDKIDCLTRNIMNAIIVFIYCFLLISLHLSVADSTAPATVDRKAVNKCEMIEMH